MCSVCNNKKSRFISKNEGSGLLSNLGIRSPVSQIALLNVLFQLWKMKTYCLVCKKLTDNNNIEKVKNNKRLMMKSNCSICGEKNLDLFHEGGGLLDSL